MKGPITATHLLEHVASQVDEAELYESRSYELPLRFRAGALESLRSVETAGRALRVIHQGRLGFSTTTDLSDGATLALNALSAAQFGDPVAFGFPAQEPTPPARCFDQEIEGLDENQLIALGEEIVERFKAYDATLQVDVSVTKKIEEVRLLNTSGLAQEDRRTSLTVTMMAVQTRDDDILIVDDMVASRRRQDVDGLAAAGRIIQRLRWSENIAAVASKPMPIVFNNTGALVPLLPLILGLNGRQVYMGTSPLGEKLGQQAFDPRLTLVDDGRLDYAGRSAPFDDEGVPTAAKPLIEGGEVQQFLYDLKTAAQAGARSTGNGFKSGILSGGGHRQQPDVVPANWLLSPGEQSLEQILKGLDEALLVEEVLGLGQGNVVSGEFSNNVGVGFLVRRGEVVGRVKNTMIAGNAYELLKDNLLALSDRAEWVLGMLHTPAIAVDAVGVVSQGA
jgi:PmbA protein